MALSVRIQGRLTLTLGVLPLAYLWGVLIYQLRIPWTISPQYAYGWAVPFLCLYLTWNKIQKPGGRSRNSEADLQLSPPGSPISIRASRLALSVPRFPLCLGIPTFALCALLYAPVCLVLEANPGWSLATWPFALLVITLTLLSLHFYFQRSPSNASKNPASRFTLRTSHFIFPLGFFLVAVPWPFVFEHPVIQGLTRLNTALTVEILGWLSIPAVPQGNVIELAAGSLGIDEACSGIRSLQATLMLSLFFGELYRLSALRRAALCLSGFALAMVCNLGRTSLLTAVASRQGIEAIAGWHDPAGVTILVACFLGVWSIGAAMQNAELRMRNAEFPVAALREGEDRSQSSKLDVQGSRFEVRTLQHVFLALTLWLLLVEAGVAAWYRHVEAGLPAQPTWTTAWPTAVSEFQEVPTTESATRLLRYDEARQARWKETDNTYWQLSWFYWKPGQVAGYLARTHNPLICMPAAGYEVVSVSPVEFVDIQELRMPLRIYHFQQEGSTVYVLYTRWEDKSVEQSFGSEGITRFNRLQSLWRGRGNHGERVLSLALWGADGAESAREQLLSQLRRVLVVKLPLRDQPT